MTGKSRKQQIEELLAAEPNDSFLRYGLAMEYLSAGQTEEALRLFQELIALDPTYPPAFLQAGQTLVALGRPDDARAIFQRGIAAAQKKGDQHAAGEMQERLLALE